MIVFVGIVHPFVLKGVPWFRTTNLISSYLTMVAIFCMFGRTAFATVILLWQNNNMTEAYRASHTFTDQEIYERVVGGKLTLVNRVIYNV